MSPGKEKIGSFFRKVLTQVVLPEIGQMASGG